MAQNDIKQLCQFNNAKEAARILYEEEGWDGADEGATVGLLRSFRSTTTSLRKKPKRCSPTSSATKRKTVSSVTSLATLSKRRMAGYVKNHQAENYSHRS